MLFQANLVRNVTKDELKRKILEEPDFIKNPKFGNSLTKFLSRNNEELENRTIARLLMIDESEVEDIYKKAVDMLRKSMLSSEHED